MRSPSLKPFALSTCIMALIFFTQYRDSRAFSDPSTGLSFTLPTNFKVTRYLDRLDLKPETRSILPNVIVLVEQTLHPNNAPIEIGSVPTITLDILTGARADLSRMFFGEKFKNHVLKKQIADRDIYELPIDQGPHERQSFYYLVPLRGNRILEIAGHRFYFQKPATADQPTHYDTIIRSVIGSIEKSSADL